MYTFKSILILFLSFFIFSSSNAEIIEISNMDEIKPYIKSDTFILFDIDNTLVEPVQELGNDQWFYCLLKSHLNKEISFETALRKSLAKWQAIQLLTEVKIVEKGTDEIISNIQKQGILAIGLTTRGLELCTCTVNQLKSLNMDLSLTSPLKTNSLFDLKHPVLFYNGILFTNGTHKGKAFIEFLNYVQLKPSHVLFINDKATHLKEIEETCLQQNMAFTGLRYGYLDIKVNNFQEEIAEIQFQPFKNILNDEAAKRILHNFN